MVWLWTNLTTLFCELEMLVVVHIFDVHLDFFKFFLMVMNGFIKIFEVQINQRAFWFTF
jgi:hypothetical protein